MDRTIDLGSFPGSTQWQVVISPNGKTAYALGYGTPSRAGVLVPVNTASGAVGKPIAVGDNASNVVISSDSKWAFVLDYGSTRSPGGVVPVTGHWPRRPIGQRRGLGTGHGPIVRAPADKGHKPWGQGRPCA